MKEFKKEKGITLIALVITIIVLLILSAITLNMVMGDNGIIVKAQKSKELTNQANAEEDVRLRILGARNEKGEINNESFLESFKNSQDEYLIELAETATLSESGIKEASGITGDFVNVTNLTSWPEIKVKVRISDYTVVKSEATNSSGSSTVATEPMIIEKGQQTARPITTADYGKKVSYLNADGTGQMANKTWRLFYVEDSSNLFKDGEGTIYLKADWTANDYTGSISYNAGTTLIRKLNPDWSKARGNNEGEWTDGEKGAARLCDTSLWEPTYKSTNTAYTNKINWVVGAPPIEMFMKSYSQRVSGATNYGAKYFSSNSPGYMYTENGTDYQYSTNDDTISLEEANGMYLPFKEDEGGQFCMEWLASPFAFMPSYLCAVAPAYLAGVGYDEAIGACPVVSLKSSVILQEID